MTAPPAVLFKMGSSSSGDPDLAFEELVTEPRKARPAFRLQRALHCEPLSYSESITGLTVALSTTTGSTACRTTLCEFSRDLAEQVLTVFLRNRGMPAPRVAAGEYSWRDRLAMIREPESGGAEPDQPPVSAWAVEVAGALASYVEGRAKCLRVKLPTVLVPSSEGGVQAEWNVGLGLLHHLEVAIPSDPDRQFELLKTVERPDGGIVAATEFSNSTLAEVLAAVEKLLPKATRA